MHIISHGADGTPGLEVRIADLGTDARGCPAAYTPRDVEGKLAAVADAVRAMGNASADERRLYVYGYDERARRPEPARRPAPAR